MGRHVVARVDVLGTTCAAGGLLGLASGKLPSAHIASYQKGRCCQATLSGEPAGAARRRLAENLPGGGRAGGVGLSSMLSSRCWTNVGPAGVAVWVVTGGWPGAVCELLSPFEHAKYHYLCKNYRYYYYS